MSSMEESWNNRHNKADVSVVVVVVVVDSDIPTKSFQFRRSLVITSAANTNKEVPFVILTTGILFLLNIITTMFPLFKSRLTSSSCMQSVLRRSMSQAATSGPDRKHVVIALGLSAAAMGVVAYMRMQERAHPELRRRTTHSYPGFLPEDAPHRKKQQQQQQHDK